MEITEGNTLEMHNVLSYRAQMTQSELIAKSQEIEMKLKAENIKKTGPTTTVTHSIKNSPYGPILDEEILIPLERPCLLEKGFKWLPIFNLTNSVKINHIGDPSNIQSTIHKLSDYIKENQLKPISPLYYVTIRPAEAPVDLMYMEVEIYISVE